MWIRQEIDENNLVLKMYLVLDKGALVLDNIYWRKVSTRQDQYVKYRLIAKVVVTYRQNEVTQEQNEGTLAEQIEAPNEEKEVDYEILDRKYPIKEWKTECLGTKPQADKAEQNDENEFLEFIADLEYSEFGSYKVLKESCPLVTNNRISHSYAGRKEVSFKKGSTDANAKIKLRIQSCPAEGDKLKDQGMLESVLDSIL
ncbi:hypothetical protein Tco_0926575 [Tanacetum coccineum]|uniref:Uncharacterized protein n=1 Tax=Tanacetum coccineum TaxID=301880 RepID=A0ABQ5DAA4_9ASTR